MGYEEFKRIIDDVVEQKARESIELLEQHSPGTPRGEVVLEILQREYGHFAETLNRIAEAAERAYNVKPQEYEPRMMLNDVRNRSSNW